MRYSFIDDEIILDEDDIEPLHSVLSEYCLRTFPMDRESLGFKKLDCMRKTLRDYLIEKGKQ